MNTIVVYYHDGYKYCTECFYNVTEWKPEIFGKYLGYPISWMFV